MSSIKQTRDRMVNNKRGLPVGANTTANTLQDLKGLLDSMYNVRANPKSAIGGNGSTNGQNHSQEVPPTSNSGVTTVGTVIPNYTAFQGSINKSPNAMSVGDYNRALDNMANCTCDARQAATCSCVSVQSTTCSCNSVYACDCVSRSAGKYGSPDTGYYTDYYTNSILCSCNSRCSCNAVREFY